MTLVFALLAAAAVLLAMVIYYRTDRNYYKQRARDNEAIALRHIEYAQRQREQEIKSNEIEKTELSEAVIDQRDAFSGDWMLDRAEHTPEASAPSATSAAVNISE